MKPNESENDVASLSQEATNESTPDKALGEQTRHRIPRRKIAPKRAKAPNSN
ncbi:MAG TPA: hypothetical protein VM735_10905 [Candidatus Kapabacteria bacterium]|nr:hypothetical protein [Candidatus Kapabacteria bacterium]